MELFFDQRQLPAEVERGGALQDAARRAGAQDAARQEGRDREEAAHARAAAELRAAQLDREVEELRGRLAEAERSARGKHEHDR